MDFYQRKVMATKMIDEGYDKGVETDLITFEVEKKFGFSDKFVEKRLEKLEKIELMATKNSEKIKQNKEVFDKEMEKILDAKPEK